ncbi:MAG: leucine-rich repeat protein [Clostridia bacterium]|nr:leucine-rich repeat protein [Clostridia bacterium]
MKTKRALKTAALLLLAAVLAAFGGCARHTHIVVQSVWTDDFCFAVYEDGTADIIAYRGEAEELKLPDRLGDNTVIGFGSKAFDGCGTLKRVLIPPTVTSLPAKLFNNCPALESVYIPSSVETIGKNVISDCPAFKQVLYAGTEEEWAAVDVGSVPWTDNYVLINAETVFGYRLGE